MTKSCFTLRLFFAYRSSHTRLRQLADFPSLIVRLTFAHPSFILYRLYRVAIKRNNQYLFIVV